MHGADFHEVVLLDHMEAAIERFNRRAKDSDDPWIRHHHRLIELGGGASVLEAMYADLVELVRQRPGTAVVPSPAGAVEETYELLIDAVGEPPSGRLDPRP
jgi:hypothetical protein